MTKATRERLAAHFTKIGRKDWLDDLMKGHPKAAPKPVTSTVKTTSSKK